MVVSKLRQISAQLYMQNGKLPKWNSALLWATHAIQALSVALHTAYIATLIAAKAKRYLLMLITRKSLSTPHVLALPIQFIYIYVYTLLNHVSVHLLFHCPYIVPIYTQ